MSQDDGREDAIAGLSKADAVEVLVAGDDDRDPEDVRATLDLVTEEVGVAEDGDATEGENATEEVVTLDGVADALAETSMAVSTAETRTEMATAALSDARDEAESVSDLGAVESRLDAFGAQLDRVETRAAELGSDLESLVARSDDPDAIYEVAVGIRRLAADANAVQRTADELQLNLESFEEWLGNAGVRFGELADDVDAIESYLDELERTADRLEAPAESETGAVASPEAGVTDADADATAENDADVGDDIDPGVIWADARLRHRVAKLLLADAQAELADLREWADREALGDESEDRENESQNRENEGREAPDPEGRADEIDARLADLEDQLAATGERLAGLADSEWEKRYGDSVAAFERATADLEPPVDWGVVEERLDEHRPKSKT